MSPAISVIIVTYNSAADIAACLQGLRTSGAEGACEVIVVDNASEDATVATVQRDFPEVRLLVEAENWGFAGGVNRGVAAAHATRLVLLNPDAVPQPGWLEQICAPLADPAVGVVGAKVLGADGHLQSVGTRLAMPVLLTAHRGDGELDTGQYDREVDVWSVHGAAMAFTRQVWAAVGGFDEGFFPAYWEESDFCERVRRAGYRVIVAPRAVVWHHEAVATGKYSAEFYYYYHRNRLRYAARWLDWPALWLAFRPAEHDRLRDAPHLDRRVARLVYAEGVPPLTPLDPDRRAAIRASGRRLRREPLVLDALDALLPLVEEAARNSVLEEVQFHSRLPLVARLRTAWNNVATRWYVRPGFDQQTRFNLAMQRAMTGLIEQSMARAAADALDVALLLWRIEQSPNPGASPPTTA